MRINSTKLEWLRQSAPPLIKRYALEGGLVAAVLAFCLALRFIDLGNLTSFLLASGYLTLGTNPYNRFAFPPPPGYFSFLLPVFGVYWLSGNSLVAADFALKMFNLAGLVVSAILCSRIASLCGVNVTDATRIRTVLLVSPVLFFVSFVVVEQDVIGMALMLMGVYFILRAGRLPTRGVLVEGAGFGLLFVSVFTYYIPIFLMMTLLAYSKSVSELRRRLAYVAAGLGGLTAAFLLVPGWNFVTNAYGVSGPSFVSVYSVVTVLDKHIFQAPSVLQSSILQVFLSGLVLLEVLVPPVFRWRGIHWTVSAAVCLSLPFLLLNFVNGDEVVWVLPFLLVSLALVCPPRARTVALWLVQACAAPFLIIWNFYDAPGAGAGTGIFFVSYPQFHDSTVIYSLVPDYVRVTRELAALTFVLIGGVLLLTLFWGWSRRARLRLSRWHVHRSERLREWSLKEVKRAPDAAVEQTGALVNSPRQPFRVWAGRLGPLWLMAGFVAVTLVASSLPGVELRMTGDSAFPTGIFQPYPVANASVNYAFANGGKEVRVTSSEGTQSFPPRLQTVPFSRNLSAERMRLELAASVVSPPNLSYQAGFIQYGSGELNLVTPLGVPASSDQLSSFAAVNVSHSVVTVDPQFNRTSVADLVLDGSSYAEYNISTLMEMGGQVNVYFNWSGTQYVQNLVAEFSIGNASYQLFGLENSYFFGEKTSTTGPWYFSGAIRVDPQSWDLLTVDASQGMLTFALNGVPAELSPFHLPSLTPSTLILGDTGPFAFNFRKFDFSGEMVGPFYSAENMTLVGAPMLCPGSSAVSSNASANGCVGFSNGTLTITHAPGSGLEVETGGATFTVLSENETFVFGRLSPVGPGLVLAVQGLQISTGRPLAFLMTMITVTIVLPVALLWVGMIVFGRVRSIMPAGQPRTGSGSATAISPTGGARLRTPVHSGRTARSR